MVLRHPYADRDHDDNGGAAMRPVREALHMAAKNRASEQGFTLIELVISLAIFSVVALAAFAVLSSTQRSAVMNDRRRRFNAMSAWRWI